MTVTSQNGCPLSDTIVVLIGENLQPEIDGPMSICANESAVLNAGLGFASYLWSTGDTTSTIEVFVAGTYSVSVTDASGCSGTDEFELQVNQPVDFEITGDSVLCESSSSVLDAGFG